MRSLFQRGLTAVVAAALVAASAFVLAAVPPMISYQGKLMQPNGTPISDGTYSVRFAVYNAPTGGEPIWSETNQSVQVKGGLFAVLLGSVNNLGANILDSQNRYLGIKIGDDAELSPRQRIASVATALRAGEADVAKTVLDGAITTSKIADGAVTSTKLADGSITSSKLALEPDSMSRVSNGIVFVSNGNIGIGTSTPSSSLDVNGEITAANMLLPARTSLDKTGARWDYYHTADFSYWTESATGGTIGRGGEGVGLDSGTGKAALYSTAWNPVGQSRDHGTARFIVRWRTSTNASGYEALIRAGTDAYGNADATGTGIPYRGVGFKQVGSTLYAYWDDGSGAGQRLTQIAVIAAPWERHIGEVERTETAFNFYLDGALKHSVTIPAPAVDDIPFGRMSLVSENAGAAGILDVNWVIKMGWGH